MSSVRPSKRNLRVCRVFINPLLNTHIKNTTIATDHTNVGVAASYLVSIESLKYTAIKISAESHCRGCVVCVQLYVRECIYVDVYRLNCMCCV